MSKMLNINKITTELTSGLSDRQKEILEGRFGLKDGQELTLQELGERYGITRERIRQIEAEGLKLASAKFKKSSAPEIVEVAKNHLDLLGGVRKEEDLVKDLQYLLKNNSLNQYQLRFIFEIAGSPIRYNEDENFNSFWYLDKGVLKKVNSFVDKANKFFANKKEQLVFNNQFNQYFVQLIESSEVNENVGLNYLAASKKFGTNPYKDFGLSQWEEITPKTARAKAFLVLKKHGKPMHFREIAESINKVGFDKKPVYAQTIHNELIKDNRFVLVGRGIYGLTEQGYFPGTARDVIKELIRTKGPLHQEEIIQLVSAQRFLKENTVLLNLQNKKHFKKNTEGKYHLA